MPEEEREELGAREIRSPLQVLVRVLLALLVVAALAGLVVALLRRPERVLGPAAAAMVDGSRTEWSADPGISALW